MPSSPGGSLGRQTQDDVAVALARPAQSREPVGELPLKPVMTPTVSLASRLIARSQRRPYGSVTTISSKAAAVTVMRTMRR